jgi:3'(2'), 5'-bisphosphate nucleotidase
LALVVEGETVLGVMGCPNWQYGFSNESTTEILENRKNLVESGVIMIAHIGCGTWTTRLSDMLYTTTKMIDSWTRCFVDGCCLVHEARFGIPDSQTWEALPLSAIFSATTNVDSVGDNQILLLPACCGRFNFV